MILQFWIFELYNLCVFCLPITEFLFLLHLACNMEGWERVPLSIYGVALMCHARENLKIRKYYNPTLRFFKCVSLEKLTSMCLFFLYVQAEVC